MIFKRLTLSAISLTVLTFSQLAAAQMVSVSPNSGQPSYVKPLTTPPGVNAFAPGLALRYTGGTAQSHFGLGWTLEGLSDISRCSTLRALDGANRGIAYSPTDKLCLDGQRLVPTSADGTPAPLSLTSQDASGMASGAYKEYRLERNPDVRVRAFSALTDVDSGPMYFKVWHSDGTVATYGNGPKSDANSNATLAASKYTETSQKAILWRLSRLTDAAGNVIDFKYETLSPTIGTRIAFNEVPGRESLLKEIQYSGNKVIFEYVDKTINGGLSDALESYVDGIKRTNTKNLASVTTYVNAANTGTLGVQSSAVPVQTYKLGYGFGVVPVDTQTLGSTGRTRLESITECFGGPASTKCLRPTTFEYSLGTGRNMAPVAASDFSLSGIALVPRSGKNYGAMLFDFDADGRTDILRWASDKTENRLFRSTGAGGFETVSSPLLATMQLGGSPCFSTTPVDFNGDGLADLFVYAPSSGLGADSMTTCSGPGSYFLRNDGGTGQFTQVPISGATPVRLTALINDTGGTRNYSRGENFYFADFTGDGKVDLLTTALPAFSWDRTPPSPNPCYGITCTAIYRGNGNGTFTPMSTNIAGQTYYDLTQVADGGVMGPSPMVRDFNGDGIDDLFIGHRWSFGGPPGNIILSNGDGTFEHRSFLPDCEASDAVVPCYFGSIDYNGDGQLDVFVGAQEGNTNKLYLGGLKQTSFAKVSTFNLDDYYYQLFNGSGSVVTAVDMNQDGLDDILRLGSFAGSPPMENALWLSRGDGSFELDTGFAYSLQQTVMRKRDGTVETYIGNFTGLGGVEFIVASATSSTLYVKTNRGLPDKLTAVTDVTGKRTEIVHVPVAYPKLPGDPLGNRYVSDRGTANAAVSPQVDLAPPSQMSVVATVKRPSGVGASTLSEEYAYGGLKYDTAADEALGFRYFKVQGVAPNGDDVTSRTVFNQTLPYLGLSAQEETYLGQLNSPVPSTPLSRSVRYFCDAQDSALEKANAATEWRDCSSGPRVLKRAYTHLSRQTGADLIGNVLPRTDVATEVNSNGAVTSQQSTVTYGSNVYTARVSTTYHADDTSCSGIDNCKWITDRPHRVTEQRTVPNALPTVTAGSGRFATSLDGSSTAPVAAVNPTSLTFSARVVGSTSAAQTVTVTNTGASPLRVSQVSVSGDYIRASNTCSSVAPGSSCTVGVKFAPTALGSRSGSLTLVHNGNPGSTSVALSGSGSGYAASLTDADYGSVRVGSTLAKTVVLKNSGSAAIAVTVPTSASVTGTDFSFGSTTCTSSLAAGASCNVVVSFAPTAAVARAGQLLIVTTGGTASSELSGTGVQGVPALSPTSLSFGSFQVNSQSVPKAVTLTNTGTASLTVLSTTAASNFSITTNECTTLAPQATCRVFVAFAPASIGAKTGQLTLTTDGTPSSVTANLSGSGVNLLLSTSVSALAFGEVQTEQYKDSGVVTLTNASGIAATGLTFLAPNGFQVVSNNCTTSLAANASCTFKVRFAPTEVNEHVGNILIRSLGKEVALGVTGTGRLPSVALGNGAFGSVSVGTTATKYVTVQNTGVGAISVNVPTDAVTGNGFTYNTTTCPALLPAGASCNVSVKFTAGFPHSASGTLKLYTFDVLKVISLSATASGSALNASTSSLSFGSVSLGASATSGTVTVNNEGNATSGTLSVLATGDYSVVSDTCSNDTLPATETVMCSFKVKFAPSAAGQRTGTVTVSDGKSSQVVAVSGTGVASALGLSTPSIAFGSVYVGQSKDSVILTLTNSGAVAATGLQFTAPAGFSVINSTCGTSLAATSSCTFKVRFTPSQDVSYSGSVRVSSTSAANDTLLTVSGTGSLTAPALAVSPNPTMDFGQLGMGRTVVDSFTVTNNGGTAQGLTYQVSSSGKGTYRIDTSSTTCVQGGTLGAGASCKVSIELVTHCLTGGASGVLSLTGSNFSSLSRNMTATVTNATMCQ